MTIGMILSGGSGGRMEQSLQKQYISSGGRPIIDYSMRTLHAHALIDRIIIVADECWRKDIDAWISKYETAKPYCYADPGETRQLSILNGLKKAAEYASDDDTVIIHDAARPLVSEELVSRCINALNGHDGVMPVLSAKDTFYLLCGDRVLERLPRSLLGAGQAPEAYSFGKYYAAHLSTPYHEILEINGSTELAVKRGLDVVTVPGEERNIKITTPFDLLLLKMYMEELDV